MRAFRTLEASSFMINGLNQAIDMYSGPVSYDARGNLTAHSGKSYDYDIIPQGDLLCGVTI